MEIPILSEDVKEALRSLPREQTTRKVSYAFEHELRMYGVNGLMHVCFMKHFSDSTLRGADIEKLFRESGIEKGVGFYGRYEKDKFSVPIRFLEKIGLFVPPQSYRSTGGDETDENEE